MGGCSHLHQAADLWASQAQERAAAWWAAARGPPAAASVAGAEWQLGGAAAASDALQQPGLMHVTLELPGGRRLGVGEDASLKDLVAHLLQEQVGTRAGGGWGGVPLPQPRQPQACIAAPAAFPLLLSFPTPALLQTGLQPSSIEVVSVEHVRQRRLSPLRAMLRAAAALRRPSAWRLPGAAPPPADDGFVDVSELAAGLGAGSSLEALAGGDVQALLQQLEPGSSSSATAEPQPPLTEALVAQKTADALAASAKQQRPASLTVEAAAQEERWASGRKLQQVRGAWRLLVRCGRPLVEESFPC